MFRTYWFVNISIFKLSPQARSGSPFYKNLWQIPPSMHQIN